MAYIIQYKNSGTRKYPRYIIDFRKQLPIIIFLSVLITVATISIINGSLTWIVPGEPEVTISAFNEFMDALSQGDSFSEAITTFCREVINGGA